MVSEVRKGASQRKVAKQFKVSLRTVQNWVNRSKGQRLDRVDWSNKAQGGRRNNFATPTKIEDLIIRVRQRLKDFSPLGEFGAVAIYRELKQGGTLPLPSIRTIGRILLRRGMLDGRKRVRRSPPGPGWYLPRVAARKMELESFDFVEGLVIRGGIEVMVFNGVTLHGGMCSSWVHSPWTSKKTVEKLISHWRKIGLPGYAQFDNDTIFHGPHHLPDCFGRVVRLCLQLGVIPVFAPPHETGFQAAIESYNGRWQAKVWLRFEHTSLASLRQKSNRYVAAARIRNSPRMDAAPARTKFPDQWKLNLQTPLKGTVIFIRRTNNKGEVEILGRVFQVDLSCPSKLFRAEVDLDRGEIRFYRLRRRDPKQQHLTKVVPYLVPKKRFHE